MKQLTIMIDDARPGTIADVMNVLAAANVNIDSISGEHYDKQTVVIASVDREAPAIAAIQRQPGWHVMSEDALLLRVEDEVGALAKVARRFTSAGLDIRSIRFVERHEGYALVAVSTGNAAEARVLVRDLLAA
jgi:hypothetical protein